MTNQPLGDKPHVHTPEPWAAHYGSGKIYTETFYPGVNHTKKVVAEVKAHDLYQNTHNTSEAEANARRIVAAVNACAGIPTEALEQGVIAEMLSALHDAMDIIQSDYTIDAYEYDPADMRSQIEVRVQAAINKAQANAEGLK
jgi:hypothetical protein